jgi:hypothetical protein
MSLSVRYLTGSIPVLDFRGLTYNNALNHMGGQIEFHSNCNSILWADWIIYRPMY